MALNRQSLLKSYTFLFAHGAGAGMDSDWMIQFESLLTLQGLNVKRFNFPYMQQRIESGKKRPPDRAPKLMEAFAQEIHQFPESTRLIIGGKSMGGRISSLLAMEAEFKERIDAVVCLGFPFHPAGKPEKFKGQHLQSIQIPTLILQGERDAMGSRVEIEEFDFSKRVNIDFLTDGDHSFKPRVKSGLCLEDNMLLASKKLCQFVINVVSNKPT